jgi:hypothetical protein
MFFLDWVFYNYVAPTALGFISKLTPYSNAVQRAYTKGALMKIPSVEEYAERATNQTA